MQQGQSGRGAGGFNIEINELDILYCNTYLIYKDEWRKSKVVHAVKSHDAFQRSELSEDVKVRHFAELSKLIFAAPPFASAAT